MVEFISERELVAYGSGFRKSRERIDLENWRLRLGESYVF